MWYVRGMDDETTEPDTLPGSLEALTEVLYAWDMYTDAKTVTDQAHWLGKLADHMGDLRSYHPEWDWEHGTMPWDREEV